MFRLSSALCLAATCVRVVHAELVDVNTQPTTNLNAGQCVNNYNAGDGFDFFPEKYAVDHADLFTVEYHKTYKIITTASAGQKVVAYQCGTPKPSVPPQGWREDGVDPLFVEVPVTKVGITSQTFISWIEFLGERQSIKHLTSLDIASKVQSPCLRKIHTDGGITDVAANTPDADAALAAAQVQVTFSDAYPWPDIGNQTKMIMSAKNEDEVLEVAEYVGMISLFYNKEAKATEIHDGIESRYACVKNNVKMLNDAAISVKKDKKEIFHAKPKVLWFGYVTDDDPQTEGAWEAAKCPNYYCETVADAGGEIYDFKDVTPEAALCWFGTCYTSYFSDAQILSMASDADYIIFTQGHTEAVAEKLDMLNNIKAFQTSRGKPLGANSDRVFHVQGRGMDDWFESRMAEPDVLLEDLVAAINQAHVSRGTWADAVMEKHTPVWIVPFSQAPTSRGDVCTDIDAPHTPLADACTSLSTDEALNIVVADNSAGWRFATQAQLYSSVVFGSVAVLLSHVWAV
jgi:hypothetical protein